MGISLLPGLFLARNAAHVAGAKNGVILGRQKLHMNNRVLERFLGNLNGMGFALGREDITQKDGFTENLLQALGYPKIEAIDFSDIEDAEHIHDLNKPVPASLRERFDLVIDGGTTEHVFHIGQALDSCHAMLKPGGIMMSFVAATGWFGHGFFQTGPDVPWRYWHHARGYDMLEVSLINRKKPRNVIKIEDPTGKPRGGELIVDGPHMLFYCCRKPLKAPKYRFPVQGHYVDY